MGPVTARIALAALSLLVLPWLGLQQFQVGVLEDASYHRLLKGDLPQDQFDRTQDRLRKARTLTPDSELDIERANLYIDRGEVARGTRIASSVARDEPDNLAAWGVVLHGAQELGDRQAAAHALAELRRLRGGSARRGARGG